MSVTVDLPVTYARIVEGGVDSFVTTLGDLDETGEIVMTVTGDTHVYPINWDGGPDVTVVLPDPPDGYTLTDAHYVALAYREAATGGGDTSGFGMNPNPDNAPYMVANTSDQFTIDYLPIGGYDGVIVGRGSEDLSLLAMGDTGDFNGDAWTVGNIVGTTDGVIHLAYLALRLVYESADGLPCDTDTELDLSTAIFITNPGAEHEGPFGQYTDGVIWTIPGSRGDEDGFPEFTFDTFTMEPTKRYRVTVTFDPDSVHDRGFRNFSIFGIPPGSTTQPDTWPELYVQDEVEGDVFTVTIGPGRFNWSDSDHGVALGWTQIWFETDPASAVSAISIRKVCKTLVPPLRVYPRPGDRFASSARVWPVPHTIQASNRRGPSAIL